MPGTESGTPPPLPAPQAEINVCSVFSPPLFCWIQYKSDVEIRDDISDVTKVFPSHTILSTKHDCLISSLLKANVGSDILDCLPTWLCERD